MWLSGQQVRIESITSIGKSYFFLRNFYIIKQEEAFQHLQYFVQTMITQNASVASLSSNEETQQTIKDENNRLLARYIAL